MMVDTEYVLAQMRAANPAPSLEQLAVDDLDLVRRIVTGERSARTAQMAEPPQRHDLLTPRRRVRPAMVTGLAFVLVLGTLGAVTLFGGEQEARVVTELPPVTTVPSPPMTESASTTYTASTVSSAAAIPPATAGSTCPPDDSTPDFHTTFDPGTGRALILAGRDFCMFDVRTNTWTAAPRPGEIGPVTDFVYDVDSERAIAFVGVQVWAYDGQGWTRENDFAVGPAAQAVYDPVTGLVVARSTTSQMWTYDVDTDTWTEVDQGATVPPATERDDFQLLTYDASVDRLILYDNYRELNTWEFDIRAGRWEEQATNTPELGWGWGPGADEFVYDEANQVSVIYGGGSQPYVATYDASEHSWTELWTPWDSGRIPGVGDAHTYWLPYLAMTYDPVNERILVFDNGMDTVIAFHVATREWIILLEPTFGPTPDFNATFDPGTGRALILDEGDFCTFDVRTNTWTSAPQPGDIGLVTDFVYDVDSDRAVAFAKAETEGVQIWAYDGQGWTKMSNPTVGPAAVQAVYDPVTGLVVVRSTTSEMWTYDVDTDTWTEVDQGATLPPAAAAGDIQLLTYDAFVDRLILYDLYGEGDPPDYSTSTWEFDVRAGRWEKQATNTPNLGLGWFEPTLEDFIYDEANQVSVIYGNYPTTVATYDAFGHSWTELHSGRIPGVDPPYDVFLDPAITYDPVNERILVASDCSDPLENGVFAFDVATRKWIILLEPTLE